MCVELLCPDVGVFRCLSFVVERLYSVVVRDVARVVSARCIDKGRSPHNCMERGCVSVKQLDAIIRDDELICHSPLQIKLRLAKFRFSQPLFCCVIKLIAYLK